MHICTSPSRGRRLCLGQGTASRKRYVWEREEEKVGLTLRSVNQQSLQALVCAYFNGPIGGLAQHGGSYSVKVKSNLFSSLIITISQWAFDDQQLWFLSKPLNRKKKMYQKCQHTRENTERATKGYKTGSEEKRWQHSSVGYTYSGVTSKE